MISSDGFSLLGTGRPLSTWGSPGGLLSIPRALNVAVFVSKGQTYQHILKYIMTIFLCDLIYNTCELKKKKLFLILHSNILFYFQTLSLNAVTYLPGLDGERDLDLSSSLAVFDLGDIHRRGDDLGDRLRPGEEGDIFLFLFLSLESFFLVLPLSDID